MKRVLLTGAAGSVGYQTLKELIASKKYQITVLDLLTKKTKKRLEKYRDQITIIYGSINDEALVSSLIKKNDMVIHLAAVIPPLADIHPELTRTVNFYGTHTIVRSIQKENPNCFFIYSSSVSVYGDRLSNPWISISDPLRPSEGDYYALTKIETEAMIQESGISYTIFRLTGIMGRPDTDPLMFHMPLATKLEIASVSDTAYAFVQALEHTDQLKGHIFNLGGGPHCRTTYHEFLKHMFTIYGLNKKYLKEDSFAEKNFHCGYFKDGHLLDDILHFQRDSLDTYYARVKKETSPFLHFFAKVFSRPILWKLTTRSEPYQAQRKHNLFLIDRFYQKKK